MAAVSSPLRREESGSSTVGAAREDERVAASAATEDDKTENDRLFSPRGGNDESLASLIDSRSTPHVGVGADGIDGSGGSEHDGNRDDDNGLPSTDVYLFNDNDNDNDEDQGLPDPGMDVGGVEEREEEKHDSSAIQFTPAFGGDVDDPEVEPGSRSDASIGSTGSTRSGCSAESAGSDDDRDEHDRGDSLSFTDVLRSPAVPTADVWGCSSGGVPPNLDLLPGKRLEEGVLARLGEGSGDEEDEQNAEVDERDSMSRISGDHEEGNKTRSLDSNHDNGGKTPSLSARRRSEEKVTRVGSSGNRTTGGNSEGRRATGKGVGMGVGGGEKAGEDGEEELEGMWDSRLDAMTRAAWLRSKQASCRGFNSNASAASVASAATSTFSSSGGAATNNTSGSSSTIPTTLPAAANTSVSAYNTGTDNFVGTASHGTAGLAGSAGLAVSRHSPALPLRKPVPNTASESSWKPRADASNLPTDGSTKCAAGVADSRAAALGSSSARFWGGTEGRHSRDVGSGGAGVGAGADGGVRVAGSGFLYRVVVDGLNILITLKLR